MKLKIFMSKLFFIKISQVSNLNGGCRRWGVECEDLWDNQKVSLIHIMYFWIEGFSTTGLYAAFLFRILDVWTEFFLLDISCWSHLA